MSIQKPIFCLIAVALFFNTGVAQVDSNIDQLRTVMPPSPNASSLGKFGEWPVGLYTGLANISVPIYDLKAKSLSVPISIDYHPAGNRVGEIASWVGLGWALSAGGCISRSVQGVPDEWSYFITSQNYSDPNNFCSTFLNQTAYYQAIGSGAQGNQDLQQDTYNLNVLGRSYRIFFKSDTTAYTMPASNIKIVKNFINSTDSTWTLILEDGTKLIFGGTVSGLNPYSELTSNVSFGTDHGGDSYVSSWYLRSMTAPTGETITFTYIASSIVQDSHFTQSDNIQYFYQTITAGQLNDPPFETYPLISSRASNMTVNQLSLSTIESDLARIYFIPSGTARQDLQGGVALSEIKVLSKLTNTYIDDWVFNYAFTRCANSNELIGGGGYTSYDSSYFHYRMKLMSLVRTPPDNSPNEVWSFTYNPTPLPSRRSFAQDYFGFYNGATSNTSLLPTIPFNPTLEALGVNYGYYPFTNIGFMNSLGNVQTVREQYVQAEMLDKITFPTGGSTVFTYEGNVMPTNQELFIDTTVTLNIDAVGGNGNVVDTLTYNFTLTQPEYVSLNFSSFISQPILQDLPGATVTAEILDHTGTAIIIQPGSGNAWYNLYLAGNYTLKLYSNCQQNEFVNNTDYIIASASILYPKSYGFQNLMQEVGGLRIKSIQDYDGISPNPVNSKYFAYDSAFVLNPVDTINSYVTQQYVITPKYSDDGQYEYVKLTRNGATKYSLGSIKGGTVGYGKVTTYNGLNGAGGYTVSSFSCDATTQAGLPAALIFPYPPNDNYEWRNGLLVSEINYTPAGIPIRATKNSYNFVQTARVTNFKVGYATLNAPLTCGGAIYGDCGVGNLVCYGNTNEAVQHVSSTQIDYTNPATIAAVTTTNYYYDDPLNMQPTRTVSIDSKGDTVLMYSRTALELADINNSIPLTTTATTALDTMIARNMVGHPVESETWIKGVVTRKTLSNYKVQSSGLVLPDNVMVQNASYPIETRLNFLNYDNYGDLLEQAKSNDVNHDYVYDYLRNYPIAEVINGNSASIAYTSFEADGTGNWTVPSGGIDPGNAITGSSSYNLSNGAVGFTGLSSSSTYVVSYWSKTDSAYSVSGTTSTLQGKTIGNWTYFEHTITGITTLSVSGGGDIDELRLYPQGALMTTCTYTPLLGISSQCDADNRITYYGYDGIGRLIYVKDQDGNIIRTYQYHYQSQTN